MLKPLLTILGAAAPLAGALPAAAAEIPAPAPAALEDFGLFDHTGKFHRLHYFAQDPQTHAIVLFVQGNGCPLVRKRIPQLNRLRDTYGPRGVVFWMINANLQDSRSEVAAEARDFDIQWPVLLDPAQLVARALGLTRTGEALVIEPDTWLVRYRGAIDDRLDYQAQKPTASHEYLKETLEAMIQSQPPPFRKTRAPGCAIAYAPAPSENDLAYEHSIAPLLIAKCADCHTSGGVAPFAMSSYKRVRGWSAMIREVLLTRQMPPWQADPHYGRFAHDLSLDPEETRRLIAWIDAGCPREDGPDPLETYQPALPEWKMGPPDFIVEIPEQSIPAEGVLDYRYLTVPAPNDRDVWISAVEVNPGNTRVLHHIIATTRAPGEEQKGDGKFLAGYAPGTGPDRFPEGTGILLRAGSTITFQLHYTASGKAESDRSRLGLHVAPVQPRREYRSGVIIHAEFKIPPGAREHVVAKSKKFRQDVLLYGMNPHMHLRGKSMRYSVRFPDGREEILLNVPHYHFDWQRTYWLGEPRRLPKGTELIVEAAWDNSTLNPNNPDPEREVTWGEQTFDEMFFASYRYILADPQP